MHVNFWEVHGVWFIIAMFVFPRLTLLFSSVPFGGFFWWLGWLIAPRLLVAILATMAYSQTNMGLVVCAWIWALCLEATEKTSVVTKGRRSKRKSTRSASSDLRVLINTRK